MVVTSHSLPDRWTIRELGHPSYKTISHLLSGIQLYRFSQHPNTIEVGGILLKVHFKNSNELSHSRNSVPFYLDNPQKKLSTVFKMALFFGRKYFELKQLNAYLRDGVTKEKTYIVGLTKSNLYCLCRNSFYTRPTRRDTKSGLKRTKPRALNDEEKDF